MHSVPGHMQGPQAQPRHPTQPFYHGQRPMRIPRVTPQGNQPVYSSPPGGQMVPMLTHTGGPQFISQGQPNQFISQHVDFPVPMGAPARYPPPQAIQGQFPPVPGPSQPQGPLLYQSTPGFTMGQPPVYILRAPTPGMSQYPQQTIEPRTREKKIIQIKDPNSNKDVTQEILKQKPAGSSSSTVPGTPNVTPNLSGQSSNSSTPPLTSQQQAEANVRAQFAAQVAATLKDSEEKPKKIENALQKSNANTRADADSSKAKEPVVAPKQEALNGPKNNDVVTNATEKASETNLKEATVTAKSQSKEDESSNSGECVLGPKSLVSSVDATNLANKKITNVRVEIFAAQEVPKRESTKISAPVVSEMIKTEEKVEPDESEKPVATDALPVSESKTLNGQTTTVSHKQAGEETEKVTTINSEVEVETAPAPDAAVAVAPEPSKAPEDDVATQNEETTQGSEEPEVLPPSSQVEEASGVEKVNGHDGERKASPASKTDSQVPVATKEMKKKKQKHRLKEMEKRSSEKEMDMMDAYTDKPVQEQVPDQAEEEPVEDTTQTQHEETTEDAPSDDETWEDKEDSWSPDLEDASDARPDGAKLTYGRDFLLQFQTNPLSMMKPEGLPDIDVVLVQARPPSKSGSQQNRMPKGDGGENMFLPSYMRQMSKGNPSGSRSGRNRNVATKKVIELPSMQQQPDLKRVDNRWVRPSEVTKGGNEEEAKTQELFRKVRGILNKLTPQKFQTLTQQIIDLDIDTQERLEGAIDLIFAKAIDEATFSVAYAKMCQFLVSENKKVVVEKDGVKKDISFRKILLNRCQKEFEKENSIEKTINEKLADLVNQGLNEEERQKRKSDLEDQVHQAKRRTLGNIRFIGELFKLKMLTESIMHDCVVKLLRSNDEESFECLCKLLVTIGKDLDHEKGKPRVDQYFAQINKIISAKITSSRVRFMMQDIMDLRNNNWVPRREDNNPKTIDQIHKEAADQAKKTQIKIQMAKQERKLQRGNMGGRDSPRPGSIPQADESWTTVGRGPRNMSVDPKKFQNLKRQVDSENISLGPGGRGYGSWARGSSGGTGAVGAGAGPSAAVTAGSSVAGSVAEPDNRPANRFSALSRDRKHSAPTRGNFGDSRRQEPRSPVSGGGRRGAVPQGEREKALQAVRAAMQPKRASQEREGGRESPRTTGEPSPAAGSLGDVPIDGSVNSSAAPEVTKETMKKKTLSIIDEFLNIKDMKEVAECLEEIGSPSRRHVFVEVTFNHTMEKRTSERQLTGKLIHFLLRDGVLTSQQYLDGLNSVFEVAEDTEIDIPQLWKYLGELMGPSAFDGNLELDVLFKCLFKHVQKHKAARLFACMLQSCEKSPEDVRAFLRAHNINLNIFFDDAEEAREFAKDKNIEYALGPEVEEELRNIILKRKARNEEVMDWIDANVTPSNKKGASFIRALVTVVCEIALEEEGEVCKCNIHKLKDRKNLLQKYIDANTDLEVQALYAVQALFLRLDRPQGFVKSYFDSLYDEEIITEISFNTWESSVEEEPGKGVTVMAASEFFRWLRSATEENDEES
ncbi:Eukaryotic translation initiation factor 4 gamma 1 [Acropora cervicornis]|uniref:Eukaryotic translation initiation factor 4 gamma 1 n=1 Tax=Acropora cervicornis TaxID=6130 RepID=A0AAD9QAL2_ACRCE|nr:Eukaryotic translation initiation factor 4 gamma 1 [Acropora cervicornis]